MSKRELSKLQVRAEVLAVIQQLAALDEASRESQLKQIKRLKGIANVDYILECLIRELSKSSYDQRQVIAQLLLEFGSLETLNKPLWAIIKDPHTSDELKDTANVVLRNLGDPTDPDLYLSYLKNPQELIDKETERMLKLASLNPEAQIDFLDFLFSLPPVEQVNLINSLKDDYPGEYLTCIFIPAIEARPQDNVINILIEALGNTRSPRALNYLDELNKYTNNELRKKLIKKSMNLLKLAGTRSENDSCYYSDLLGDSKVYKCYVSPIDGIGNQGVIISRLKDNNDISLFSVVINDMQGVLDCFGFSQISQNDFERIIKKFQEGTTRINIPPGYCKQRMLNAEKINKSLEMPIPYEYSAWKSLSEDIPEFEDDTDDLVENLKTNSLLDKIHRLYELPDFYCWFIEDDDHPHILNFFEDNLKLFISSLSDDSASYKDILTTLDNNITNNIENIFDLSWRELYYQRLSNETYLLKYYDLMDEARLAATAAWSLTDTSLPLKENRFLQKLLRKSIAECLLRFQYKIDDNFDQSKCVITQDQVFKYKEYLDKLFVDWQVDF